MLAASTTMAVNTPNTNNIKGAFTLGVRDSRVGSGLWSHHASHLGLKPSCHESIMLS